MIRLPRIVATALLALLAVFAPVGPAAAQDADASFGESTAGGRLGEPVVFSALLRSAAPPARVELLSRLPSADLWSVSVAETSPEGEGIRARVEVEGHVVPNTTFRYRFRAVWPDGTETVGEEASFTVRDERFGWRTLEGSLVRLHWYEGDEAFARRALDIGEAAIEEASTLLGVTETDPVDFFIYAGEGDFRTALGPGTRENVGGQANAAIRTLFGLIEPTDVGSDWVNVLVTHELTHLVFDTAVRNPYHQPPRWLNEGLAVYLSEGYGAADRLTVEAAARNDGLIPLRGLGGLFPTTRARFDLAYAESVSAVDFFIDRYGEPELVRLVRSYADGVTDDEAFRAATGADLASFDAAWIDSLGAEVPEPVGPRPAPTGELPPEWTSGGSPPPSVTPGASPPASVPPDAGSPAAPVETPAPAAPATAAPSPGAERPDAGGALEGLAVPVLVGGSLLLVAAGGTLLLRRRRG